GWIFSRHKRIGCGDSHPQGRPFCRGQAGNGPEAHQSETPTRELVADEIHTGPGTRGNPVSGEPGAPEVHQRSGDHVFRVRQVVGAGGRAHGDTACFTVFIVDVVEAYSEAADHFQTWCGLQQSSTDLSTVADNQRAAVDQRRMQLGRLVDQLRVVQYIAALEGVFNRRLVHKLGNNDVTHERAPPWVNLSRVNVSICACSSGERTMPWVLARSRAARRRSPGMRTPGSDSMAVTSSCMRAGKPPPPKALVSNTSNI